VGSILFAYPASHPKDTGSPVVSKPACTENATSSPADSETESVVSEHVVPAVAVHFRALATPFTISVTVTVEVEPRPT
jgi:hypothetical protein